MKTKLFSYNQLDTFIHRLSGLTKLLCFILLTSAVMLTYDIRVNIVIMILSMILMRISRIRFSQIKIMLIYVMIFLVTKEQLFYQITKFSKYLSVIPLGMIFIFTTNPSEFASSLNTVGVSYRVCTSLSLTLRYFPDVTRDYTTISLAQQARGLEMTSKAKFADRAKSVAGILVPLILTTIDRIDLISNAMDLRGFGKNRKRTWYARRPFKGSDNACIAICILILLVTLYIRFFINGGYFYNPFVQ